MRPCSVPQWSSSACSTSLTQVPGKPSLEASWTASSTVPTLQRSLCPRQEALPELPAAARQRYLDAGLGAKETLAMTDDMATAAYYDAVVSAGAPAKTAANWVLGDLTAHCKVLPC